MASSRVIDAADRELFLILSGTFSVASTYGWLPAEVSASMCAKWPLLIPTHTGPRLLRRSPIPWPGSRSPSFPRVRTDFLASGGGSPSNWQPACETETRQQRRAVELAEFHEGNTPVAAIGSWRLPHQANAYEENRSGNHALGFGRL
jgi:hypothetical protein